MWAPVRVLAKEAASGPRRRSPRHRRSAPRRPSWPRHRPNGFFIVKEGWEYNLILAVAAVAVATIGPGRFSLDYALFHTSGIYDFLHGWWGLLISAGLGLAGGIGQLVIFWRPPAKAEA